MFNILAFIWTKSDVNWCWWRQPLTPWPWVYCCVIMTQHFFDCIIDWFRGPWILSANQSRSIGRWSTNPSSQSVARRGDDYRKEELQWLTPSKFKFYGGRHCFRLTSAAIGALTWRDAASSQRAKISKGTVSGNITCGTVWTAVLVGLTPFDSI